MSGPVLETRGLRMAFGALIVFDSIDFLLHRGERHAIIGPNGAGKTTFVSLVTGLLAPHAGQVLFNGRDITHATPQQRVKLGLVRTFQINSLFPALTPIESIVAALCQREMRNGLSLTPVVRSRDLIEEADALLEKFGLQDDAHTTTSTLPYGKQRLLEIVLALALKPQVILLDEPAAGLSTQQGHDLFEQVAHLGAGTTILFIEHDMNLVFRYAHTISVFAGGALLLQGTPDEIRRDPRVREVYLGS